MKYIVTILTFSLSLFLFVNGCDSPSGSKPDTVSKPSLVSPTDNATNVSLTPTFTWNGEANILEIGNNPSFSPAIYTTEVSGQSYTLPSNKKLSRNTRYYWHAGKKSSAGTDWSDAKFTFVTVQ